MCKALLPGDDEGTSDEAIWETLPVSLSELIHLMIIYRGGYNLFLIMA